MIYIPGILECHLRIVKQELQTLFHENTLGFLGMLTLNFYQNLKSTSIKTKIPFQMLYANELSEDQNPFPPWDQTFWEDI